MRRRTWFGTRGMETWVPTPAINPDYARSGYQARAEYLTGGAGIRASKNAHNRYTLSWGPTKSRDEVRLITDFAEHVYDTQDDIDLIYWIDPMAADKNVFAQAWATPSLGCEDAPPLITDSYGFGRPEAVSTPTNSFRFPARGARFSQDADSKTQEIYIPIPPGFAAWVGVHGDEDADERIFVQRVNGYTTVGAAVNMSTTGTLSDVRVTEEFSSAQSSGIVVGFNATDEPIQFILYGLCCQILPLGQPPVNGNWISGQGNAGCQFDGQPSKTPYSAKLDRVALTAVLEETGMDL